MWRQGQLVTWFRCSFLNPCCCFQEIGHWRSISLKCISPVSLKYERKCGLLAEYFLSKSGSPVYEVNSFRLEEIRMKTAQPLVIHSASLYLGLEIIIIRQYKDQTLREKTACSAASSLKDMLITAPYWDFRKQRNPSSLPIYC